MSTVAPALPRAIPGPRGIELVRRLVAMRREPLGALEALVADYGDAVSLPTGRLDLVLLNHPDQVQHVLLSNAKAYGRSASYREIELVLGKGLLTSEGEFWKRQRRIAQPSFRKNRIAGLAPLINRETASLIERWRGQARLDVDEEMVRLTLAVVGQAFFSMDLSQEADRLRHGLEVCLPFVVKRTEAIFNFPMWVPFPAHLRFRREVRRLDALVHGLIDERRLRGEQEAPDDLLSSLVFARDPESGEAMNTRQVRDEIVTFLLAGHETTAHALAWTLHLLATHPQAAERLREEERQVLDGRPPTPEDLPRMAFTRRVVLESLRLRPPAWIIEREALVDDVVGGWRVPKGSLVMLCTHTVHRHAEAWIDPLRFDPDRFLPARSEGRHRCAFFPFGAGQRQCIGEGIAMVEMQLILPQLLRAFDLSPPEQPVTTDPGVTLRPAGGIALGLRVR